ncbi:OmpA family protein [Erwiniaceae bacterium L1_54_6]|jgi:outer membrane protein OmpA-like peptidoglycan-associated protein|nr:OmpA family protein [Erwiniaceae bacterium L1_54_6]
MKLKALLLLCIVACAGCQSKRTFTDEQIAAMRKEGFSPNAEGWGLGMSDKILFGINESELTPESKTTINRMATNLAVTGIEHLRIDGHTDNYGTASYNEQLSLKRADAVAAQWATGASLPRSNIETRGLGMKYPVTSNNTAQGRAQNRRVAVVITAP